MLLYFAVAVFTIFLAYLTDNHPITVRNGATTRQMLNKVYLTTIFLILFFLAAFRLEVGNDYGTYVTTCHEIFNGGYVVTEPGYNFVVKLLYTLSGKEDYLLMFAVFAFATTFLFLKAFFDQSASFKMTFFLFMTLGIYFRTFNTVRYYFVLAITLYSLRYVVRREYGKFILMVLFASLFHKSVLVVIPLYLVANRTFRKWQLAGMAGVGALVFFGRDYVMEVALKLYPSYVNTPYLEQSGGMIGNLTGIGRCLAVLLLCLICYRESIQERVDHRLYFNLNLMAILLYVCASFLPLVSRFAYYLMTPHIFLIPGVLHTVKNAKKKKILTIIVIISGLFYFLLFLKTAGQEGVRVLPYHSWLFYEKEFLDATKIF